MYSLDKRFFHATQCLSQLSHPSGLIAARTGRVTWRRHELYDAALSRHARASMKIAVVLALTLLALAGVAWFFSPSPDPLSRQPRSDLPWQVEALENGDSRVFDLILGQATLRDALRKFGAIDGIAVFRHANGARFLEGYFRHVLIGPLKAKAVVGLHAPDALLDRLISRSGKPDPVESGAWKYGVPASEADTLLDLPVRVITFIPGTRELDAAFFRARLGEPDATLTENEHAISWFYPEKGLSVLIDSEGGEALELVPPRAFRLPAGAVPSR